MIELNAVSKRYGRRGGAPDVLHDVSAHVPRCAVWAIVGPNGAGKSTLLSIVLGFIRPSSGSVRIDGQAPRDFVRDRGASYLPERFALPSAWTVRDALQLFAQLDGREARVARTVDVLALEPMLTQRIGALSRGMLQRLALAQAILTRREVVVLDEPTEGLDPIWRIRLRDAIRTLRDDGATILVASHDLTEIERIADRALVLDRGAVRTVLDTQTAEDAAVYRITLRESCAALHDSFPDASRIDDVTFTAAVSGAAELTDRLSALIAGGAVIVAVVPVRASLEERVRDTLAGET
jgi:ABC-type multidrug transport system ATPase subunit